MESLELQNNTVVSLEECQKYLRKYKLTDERIFSIRDNLEGIIGNIINSYIEEFK